MSEREGNPDIFGWDGGYQGTITPRVTHSSRDISPGVQSEGESVLFASDRDGDFDIYGLSDGRVTQITDDPATESDPTGSFGAVYFVSDRDGNQDIYSIASPGATPVRLTATEAAEYDLVAGGRLVFFVSELDGNPEIYRVNADGSGVTRLTTTAAVESNPAFHPHTTRLAWISDGDVVTADADGTNQTRLSTPEVETDVTWHVGAPGLVVIRAGDVYVSEDLVTWQRVTDTTAPEYDLASGYWWRGLTPLTPPPTSPGPSPHESVSPRPSSPPPSPGASIHDRSLSLHLRRHLRGRGLVTTDGPAGCVSEIHVRIELRRNRMWTFAGEVVTDTTGSYRTRLPDKQGRYRALIDEYILGAHDLCEATASAVVRHLH